MIIRHRKYLGPIAMAGFLLLGLIAFFGDTARVFQGYLHAFLYWSSFGLGGIALILIFRLTGGNWGAVSFPYLNSSARTVPWMGILFLPILFGAEAVYPWVNPEHAQAHGINLRYLNLPFFIARTIVYFLIWWILVRQTSWKTSSPRPESSVRKWSAGGLVLLALTVTFASMDWVMSLEAPWYSTVFGLLFFAGQILSMQALVLVCLWKFPPPAGPTPDRLDLRNLGNLLLGFVIVWTYLYFVQYLILWSGNIPEEVTWMIHRVRGGWQYLAYAMAVFLFAIPFLILLFRSSKENLKRIGPVALGILAIIELNALWLVLPTHLESVGLISWADFISWISVGSVWLLLFLRGMDLSRRAT